MTTRRLRFEFLSYWQVSSGLGHEAAADSVVARDRDGLPLLPGKTIKGLLREAMDVAGIPRDRILRWFGSENPGVVAPTTTAAKQEEADNLQERGRYATQPGELWFGSATLPDTWRHWVRQSDAPSVEKTLATLHAFVASTSIDGSGVALDKTLRVAEVTVPMTLHGIVSGPEGDAQWIADVTDALPFLRAVGSRRHRGYGRVCCGLEEAE